MNDDQHDFSGDGICPCQPTLIHLTDDGRAVWWHRNPEYSVPPPWVVAEMVAKAKWMDMQEIGEAA